MKYTKAAALMGAVCLLLAGCSSARSEGAQSSQTETTAAAENTTAAPETTSSKGTTTTAAPATTAADETTTGTAETTDAAETTTAAPAAQSVKLLWSERGLEAVAADSEDGYGEELAVGTEYLDWKLERFDGSPTDLNADFSRSSELSVNGIMTVLPDSHPDYPNGLYLRVDNQADFPYFPADSRERGKFIIENADDVYEWLELDEPPVSAQYEIAVTVSVKSLHVHYAADGYDTVTVTSASKR